MATPVPGRAAGKVPLTGNKSRQSADFCLPWSRSGCQFSAARPLWGCEYDARMPSTQRDSGKSPRFAQPATFMRLPYQTDLAGVDVAMLGVPFDSGTSYRSGARLGPREIRAQSSLIRPYSYFQKVSPFKELTIVDAGDVDAPPVGIEP